MLSVQELAERLGGRVQGDPDRVLTDVRDLRQAGPDHVAFLANPRYRRFLDDTQAGAVLVRPGVECPGKTLIVVPDPYAAFARAVAVFHPLQWPAPGVDPRAAVDGALGPDVHVEPFAVVRPGAQVGQGSWLQAGCYVGQGAVVGARCRLMPGSVVMDGCVLGDDVWLNPGAVIGGEGFGFAPTARGMLKIPQVGRAVIGDGVEVGANACVDRGALQDTRVGAGVKMDNLVQIGHGAQIGPHSVLVAYAGVAGSSRLGPGVTLAARATVLGHLEIGAGSLAAAHAMVAHDQPDGSRVAGVPAVPHKQWLRASHASNRAHELERELRALKRRIEQLEADRGPGSET